METWAPVLSIALASLNLQGNGYCLAGCQCHDNLVVVDVHASLWLVKHLKKLSSRLCMFVSCYLGASRGLDWIHDHKDTAHPISAFAQSMFRLPAKRNDIGEIQDDHDIVIETHGFYEGLAE